MTTKELHKELGETVSTLEKCIELNKTGKYEQDDKGDLMVFTEREVREFFDEMLDDCNPDPVILGHKYPTSRVLKEVDPILYEQAWGEFTHFDGFDEVTNNVWCRLKEEFRP